MLCPVVARALPRVSARRPEDRGVGPSQPPPMRAWCPLIPVWVSRSQASPSSMVGGCQKLLPSPALATA